MGDFMLGAMYWLNPNHGSAEIEDDMRRIRDNNFNIIRSFAWWEKIEAREGIFDFRQQDFLHEAAARQGLAIMETFGFYLPPWLQKRLVAQGIDDRDRRYACFDRPEVAAPLENYLRRVAERYKDSPALAIWNLWNEPTKPACRCPSTLRLFARWLKERYADAGALHAAWLGEGQVFATLAPDSLDELTPEWLHDAFEFGSRGRVTPMEYDWQAFAAENLAENLSWIRGIVRSVDTSHPVHANPCTPFGNSLNNGVDGWKVGRVLDNIGISLHASHFNFQFEAPVNFPVAASCGMDEVHSWARGKDAWIGELQAGTTFNHSSRYTPDPSEIVHDVLHAAGRGLRGVLFWEWQSWRSSMMEVGEFSLRRSHDGGPTPRSEAAGNAGRIVRAAGYYLAGARRPRSAVAVMTSMATQVYRRLEGMAKPHVADISREHGDAFYGCYRALNRANIPVEFVTEAEVAEGILSDYRVLYLPLVEVIGSATAARLKEFVAAGGALWADGRAGFLDEHVFIRNQCPGHGLDEVFGCHEADFVAARDNGDSEMPIHRCIQYLEPTTGAVIARHGGTPTAVRNHYGKGVAELWGSLLTLGAVRGGLDIDGRIERFALENGAVPSARIEPAGQFECSRLHGPDADILVVSNRAAAPQMATLFLDDGIGKAITFQEKAVDHQGNRLNMNFAAKETVLLALLRTCTNPSGRE